MTRAVSDAGTAPTRYPMAGVAPTGSPCRRPQRVAVFVLPGLVLLTHALAVAAAGGYFDLRVYHGAVNHWVDGGHLYAYTLRGGRYGYTYPPFAALTMLPMAVVPVRAAIAVSVVLTTAAAVAVPTGWSTRSPGAEAGTAGSPWPAPARWGWRSSR